MGLSGNVISKPKRAMARYREGSTPKRATALVLRGIHSKACSGLDMTRDPFQSALWPWYREGSIPKRATISARPRIGRERTAAWTGVLVVSRQHGAP